MRRFFGKRDPDKEPSKEELERQAAEELGGWMGAGAGAPPSGESTWSAPQAGPPQYGAPPPQSPPPPSQEPPRYEPPSQFPPPPAQYEPPEQPQYEPPQYEAPQPAQYEPPQYEPPEQPQYEPPPASQGPPGEFGMPSQAPPSQLGPPPQAPPSAATLGPSTTAPGPMFFGDPAAHSSGTPPEEEEAVTELALQQLADRSGGRLEDLAIGKPDPASAEAMRDRALSEFMQRKAELDRRRFEQEQTRLRQPQLDQEEEEDQLGPVEGPDELRLEEPAAPSEVRLDADEEARPRRKAGAGSTAKATARKSTRKASGAKSSAKASTGKSTKKGSGKSTKKGSAGRSTQKRKRPES